MNLIGRLTILRFFHVSRPACIYYYMDSDKQEPNKKTYNELSRKREAVGEFREKFIKLNRALVNQENQTFPKGEVLKLVSHIDELVKRLHEHEDAIQRIQKHYQVERKLHDSSWRLHGAALELDLLYVKMAQLVRRYVLKYDVYYFPSYTDLNAIANSQNEKLTLIDVERWNHFLVFTKEYKASTLEQFRNCFVYICRFENYSDGLTNFDSVLYDLPNMT